MSHHVVRAWCAWLLAWCLLPMGEAAAKPTATPAHGVGVIGLQAAAGVDASTLARAVYRDPALRPRFNEVTARELIGAKKSTNLSGALNAARAATGDIQRRLLVSIGNELGVKLLAVVEAVPKELPHVRVLDVQQARFLSMLLRPTLEKKAPQQSVRNWADTVLTLRALHGGQATGPRRQTPRPGSTSSAPDKKSKSIWKSPWFWTGIGVVATAGITVIVLSQTVGKKSDVVAIDGQIGQ